MCFNVRVEIILLTAVWKDFIRYRGKSCKGANERSDVKVGGVSESELI